MSQVKQNLTAQDVEGKMIYVLGIVVIVQFSFPITDNNNLLGLILYQILYVSFFGVGIMLSRHRPRLVRGLSVMSVLWVLATIFIYALNSSSIWALLIIYFVYEALLLSIVFILMEFIFQAKYITRGIIYAAIATYLLLGAIFVPIYGIIETITYVLSDGTVNAFVGSNIQSEILRWQDFQYYSYVTLTTVGYGDILPVTMVAKSAAIFEAVMGVMYVTIIMARLVSLYSADPAVGENKHDPQ